MASALKNEVPNFIQARTPKELRALFLETNFKMQMTIQYFDIQFVSGKWYAWYYEPLDKSEEVREIKNIKAS